MKFYIKSFITAHLPEFLENMSNKIETFSRELLNDSLVNISSFIAIYNFYVAFIYLFIQMLHFQVIYLNLYVFLLYRNLKMPTTTLEAYVVA